MFRRDFLSAGYWLLLVGLLLAIYLPGLGNELVFDDRHLADRSLFERYGSLLEWKQRMLSYGSFVWVEQLLGEGWWKQRLVNLALHAGVVVALYAFYVRLLGHVRTPGLETGAEACRDGLRVGILVFALNPVAVYGVAYLIQRSILMATLFSVLACIAFLRALERRSAGWFAAALVAYLCAMLSKEHALMLPALALPLFVFVRRPPLRTVMLMAVGVGVLIAAAVVALFSVYGDLVGQVFDAASRGYVAHLEGLRPGVASQIHALSVLNQMALFFHYGVLWFVPDITSMSIDMRPAFPLSLFSFPEALAALAYVALLAGSVWTVAKRSDLLGFVALCLLFPLLLFATEFATVWIQDPFVLYRSYLWAIAIPGMVSAALVGLRPFPLYVGGFVVALVFTALAFERTQSLRDGYRVWSDAADKIDLAAPPAAVGRARPFLNRGSYFLEHLMPENAYPDFARAIELGEDQGSAYFNLGVTLQLMQRHADAIRALDTARDQGFDRSGLHYHRGESLYALGRFDEAVEAFSMQLGSRGQDPKVRTESRLRRAESAIAARQFDLAIRDLEALRNRSPGDVRILTGLGMAYVGAGDAPRALAQFDLLLRGGSQQATVHYGRALALAQMNVSDGALRALELALALDPDNPVYLQLRAQLGR